MAKEAINKVASVATPGSMCSDGVDIGKCARRDVPDLDAAKEILTDLWRATQGGLTINGVNIGALAMNTLSALG